MTENRIEMDCTIIIPAFNASAFIRQSVESALTQDAQILPKVIVVDDGSSDDTARIVSAIKGVELIRQPNAGVSAARNAGLALADTEFVIFLDADDILLPDAVTRHQEAFSAHPDAVMVLGSNLVIDENGMEIGANHLPHFKTRDFLEVAMRVTPCPSQVMLRRNFVLDAGGFDPGLKGAEDADLWLRLIAFGEIVCHGALVMKYRKHSTQATKRPSKIFAAHKTVLQRRLQDETAPSDRASLKSLERRWQIYFGQYLPIEIVRLGLNGRFAEAWEALLLFAGALPASAIGAARFLFGKVRRKYGWTGAGNPVRDPIDH